MNKYSSIIIRTGLTEFYDNYPRRHYFDYSGACGKYAMLHIRIRNDYGPKYARTLYVYYANKKEDFLGYIFPRADKNDMILFESFRNYSEIWIDEWERRRNGDLYKLYDIDDVSTENAKKMLKRMKSYIRGADESEIELNEDEIYRFDCMHSLLPNKFKIYKDTTIEEINKIYGYNIDCKTCGKMFGSRNSLFRHLLKYNHFK